MDIGGLEDTITGSRLLTAEDVAEVTKHIERLESENAKLRKLARWMHQVMDESCAVRYPYEPAPVSMQAISRAEKELQALGIEVSDG